MSSNPEQLGTRYFFRNSGGHIDQFDVTSEPEGYCSHHVEALKRFKQIHPEYSRLELHCVNRSNEVFLVDPDDGSEVVMTWNAILQEKIVRVSFPKFGERFVWVNPNDTETEWGIKLRGQQGFWLLGLEVIPDEIDSAQIEWVS